MTNTKEPVMQAAMVSPKKTAKLEFENDQSEWTKAKRLIDSYYQFCNKLELGNLKDHGISSTTITLDRKISFNKK